MTTSIRIICDGNTEGDKVKVRFGWGKPEQIIPGSQVLERGDISERMSAGGTPLWLRIDGEHGTGESLGDLDIFAVDRAYHKGDCPAPGTFGWALFMMKRGHRVMRRGWNGKGMYLFLFNFAAVGIRGIDHLKPCIIMHTAQGHDQPGWLASQPDMLEEDWKEYVDA